MIGKKKPIKTLVATSLAVIAVVILAANLIWTNISAPADPNDTQTEGFSIARGESIDSIGQRLKKQGIIKSVPAFRIAVIRLGLAKQIQAGQFQLSPSWKINQVIQSLTLGRDDTKVTVIEGLRREEIASTLEQQLAESGVTFYSQQFLSLTNGKEGYLFPDTYFFPKSVTTEEIAETLLDTFEQKVDQEMRSQIAAQGLTLDQALILASMVEREARSELERPIVAGIITKRWREDWRLQVDATVQYALGYQPQTNSWWKKDLTRADLEINSPFNTYQRYGLPPTPICNPSLSSINAVANQVSTDYYYYISDPQGNMHYAETIDGHNANIARYLGK